MKLSHLRYEILERPPYSFNLKNSNKKQLIIIVSIIFYFSPKKRFSD